MPICTASAPIRAEEERQGLWRDGIYEQIGEVMPMQGGLRIEGMCHLARVSRSGFYRSLQDQVLVEAARPNAGIWDILDS